MECTKEGDAAPGMEGSQGRDTESSSSRPASLTSGGSGKKTMKKKRLTSKVMKSIAKLFSNHNSKTDTEGAEGNGFGPLSVKIDENITTDEVPYSLSPKTDSEPLALSVDVSEAMIGSNLEVIANLLTDMVPPPPSVRSNQSEHLVHVPQLETPHYNSAATSEYSAISIPNSQVVTSEDSSNNSPCVRVAGAQVSFESDTKGSTLCSTALETTDPVPPVDVAAVVLSQPEGEEGIPENSTLPPVQVPGNTETSHENSGLFTPIARLELLATTGRVLRKPTRVLGLPRGAVALLLLAVVLALSVLLYQWYYDSVDQPEDPEPLAVLHLWKAIVVTWKTKSDPASDGALLADANNSSSDGISGVVESMSLVLLELPQEELEQALAGDDSVEGQPVPHCVGNALLCLVDGLLEGIRRGAGWVGAKAHQIMAKGNS